MPLSDDPRKPDFLQQLAEKLRLSDNFDQVEAEKERLLQQALASLDPSSLREQMNFRMETRDGKTVESLDSQGQIKSVETGDTAQYKGFQATDQKTSEQVERDVRLGGQAIFDQLARLMPRPPDPPGPFDAEEIGEEFFEPLVRQGLIPENLVPDAYSSTRRMLDAAGAGFADAQAEAASEQASQENQALLDPNRKTKAIGAQLLSTGKSYLNYELLKETLSADGVATDLSVLSSQLSSFSGGHSELSELKSGVEAAVVTPVESLLLDPIEAVVDPTVLAIAMVAKPAGLRWKDDRKWNLAHDQDAANSSHDQALLAGLDKALDGISAALTKTLGRLQPQFGVLVGREFQGAVGSQPLADFALKRPTPDGEAIVDGLTVAISKSFHGTAADPANEQVFNEMASAASAAFRNNVNGKELTKGILKTPEAAFASLVAAGAAAAAKVAGPPPVEPADADDDAAPAANARPNEFQQFLAQPEAQERVQARLDQVAEQEALAELQQSRDETNEYERQLSQTGAPLDQKSILQLIEKLREDKSKLIYAANLAASFPALTGGAIKSAAAAGSAGAEQVASTLVPALRAAGLTAQFVANIFAAVDRWRLWGKLKVSVDAARKANSPLAPAIARFSDNRKEQITYHVIQDALMIAQIVGSSISAAAVTAAAGEAVYYTARLASVATEKLNEKYNQAELEKAWAATEAFLQDPSNRRLGLEAMQLNTTLATCAIVWAALEKRDTIARKVLDDCGLDENALDHEETSASAVRRYLQERFNEDRQTLDRKKHRAPPWRPKKVNLSRACWYIAVKGAEEKAQPALNPASPGGKAVETALAACERCPKDLGGVEPAELTGYLKDAEALVTALESYMPLAAGGNKEHEEMRAFARDLTAAAKSHRELLAAELASRAEPQQAQAAAGGAEPQPQEPAGAGR